MKPLRRNHCAFWIAVIRFCDGHYGVEESTWEREDTMRATYPLLFRDEGTWFSCLNF